MTSLLLDVDLWCKEKSIPAMELRAILQNEEAIRFWDKSSFERFYIRYRKRIR